LGAAAEAVKIGLAEQCLAADENACSFGGRVERAWANAPGPESFLAGAADMRAQHLRKWWLQRRSQPAPHPG